MKYRKAHGFKITNSKIALAEPGCELRSIDNKPLKIVEVAVPGSLIKQWYEELKLGIEDDWGEDGGND